MAPLTPPTPDEIARRFPGLAAHLDASDMTALADQLSLRLFRNGDELLSQGSPFPTLYLLWEGAFALQFGEEKDAADLGSLPPNAIVGEVSFFDGGAVTATVRLMSRSGYALALEAPTFDAF